MATTPRLGLRLLEATDVANFELINQMLTTLDAIVVKLESLAAVGGHNHAGADGSGPKIPYANLTGAPASLPANGGDADTVDGKHASDFSAYGHVHPNATTSFAGYMSETDKSKLDTVSGRVDQSLLTTSSPTFNVVTAAKVIGAVYQ